MGNIHFKSSVNRAPKQSTPGEEGETRSLQLELKVLADVGLLGMPNAGKSTLITTVSAARPKIANYPFTTLHPNLGVVRIDENHSFIMADIPGLIEGAAEGADLGHRFLKGVTIVITTHFMEEAEYCDRIVIQDAGRMLALGTPHEVRAQAGEAGSDMNAAFIAIVERGRGGGGS